MLQPTLARPHNSSWVGWIAPMVVNERAADKQSWAANMVKYSQAHRRHSCNNPSSQLDLLAEVAAYELWTHDLYF